MSLAQLKQRQADELSKKASYAQLMMQDSCFSETDNMTSHASFGPTLMSPRTIHANKSLPSVGPEISVLPTSQPKSAGKKLTSFRNCCGDPKHQESLEFFLKKKKMGLPPLHSFRDKIYPQNNGALSPRNLT
jgi:hypothetical protein